MTNRILVSPAFPSGDVPPQTFQVQQNESVQEATARLVAAGSIQQGDQIWKLVLVGTAKAGPTG